MSKVLFLNSALCLFKLQIFSLEIVFAFCIEIAGQHVEMQTIMCLEGLMQRQLTGLGWCRVCALKLSFFVYLCRLYGVGFGVYIWFKIGLLIQWTVHAVYKFRA